MDVPLQRLESTCLELDDYFDLQTARRKCYTSCFLGHCIVGKPAFRGNTQFSYTGTVNGQGTPCRINHNTGSWEKQQDCKFLAYSKQNMILTYKHKIVTKTTKQG